MAKRKKTKKAPVEVITLATFMPMELPVHPSEDQEDPINGKYEKTIEITPWGPDWK